VWPRSPRLTDGTGEGVALNWPNKTQRRVLRELAEVTTADSGYFPEERLAKRLDMPVEEVRRHLQVLADLGMVEEAR
jgi:predicted ArsR family transcriptional regulator